MKNVHEIEIELSQLIQAYVGLFLFSELDSKYSQPDAYFYDGKEFRTALQIDNGPDRYEGGTDNLIGLCLWDDDFIFTGGQNKKLKLVDLNLKSVIKELNEHNQWICSIKSIKHKNLGQILITHGLDNKIKLWEI